MSELDPSSYEQRQPPNDPKLLAAAATAKPGAWVYQIDWDYPAEQRTPPEAIRGGWEVGPEDRLTGRYAPNPRYRAIQRLTRFLKPYMHAGATAYPSRWIVDTDDRGEAHFPAVPEKYIRGWWYVDHRGKITDQFRPNSRWSDPQDELQPGK